MSEVVFIGTSDAFGAGGRRQAAILARTPGGTVLLDCAPTTGTGLGAMRIARDEIDAIVVSHFHADHFGGIPQFLLAAHHEDGRKRPLRIAGPPGVEARVRAASAVLGHPLEKRDSSFRTIFVELRAGTETQVGPVRVAPFEVYHDPASEPHGLSISDGRHRIVYSGDTGWFDPLPARARGADLFICECTFLDPVYEHHLSHAKLVEKKAEFECGRIILTHLGEAMSARRGGCVFETADDGLSIRVG